MSEADRLDALCTRAIYEGHSLLSLLPKSEDEAGMLAVVEVDGIRGGGPRFLVPWACDYEEAGPFSDDPNAVAERDDGMAVAAGKLAARLSVNLYRGVPSRDERSRPMLGLRSWLPVEPPLNREEFLGVDRSIDPVRLAGIRWDGRRQPICEAIDGARAVVRREGGLADVGFASQATHDALVAELGCRVTFADLTTDEVPGLVFRGVRLLDERTGNVLVVLPDADCPARTVYLLTMRSWSLGSMRRAPHVLSFDGGPWMRPGGSTSTVLGRVATYVRLATNAPGHNAVVMARE